MLEILGRVWLNQGADIKDIPNDISISSLFDNLPLQRDFAELKEQFEKLKIKYDELERQTNSKHAGSQQEIQHMGGSGTIGEDIF